MMSDGTLAQLAQSTVGDCSPAVADTKGNVVINCTFGTSRIAIPQFKGDLLDKEQYKNNEHPLLGYKVLGEIYNFVTKNLNSIVYMNINFDVLNYHAEGNCETFRNQRDMCLEFTDIHAKGINMHLVNAQRLQDQECGFVCMPCNHGSCKISGFFIAREAVQAGQGWVFMRLSQLPTGEMLVSPKYNAPK